MRRVQALIVFASLAFGCVDPVNLSLPATELPLILEGHVTDDATTPDTIRLSKSYPADGAYHPHIGIPGAKLWISDDAGTVDTLLDLHNGIYVTNALQGVVGRTYTLEGITKSDAHPEDDFTIRSTPELMLPAGTIDSIYFEHVSNPNAEPGVPTDGLNIYIDATVAETSSHRMRWKFMGTYSYVTDPAALQIPLPCPSAPDCPTAPPACAANCECCNCWAFQREDLPLVAPATFLGGTEVNHVFMKYIAIDNFTFSNKYRVEITQMELSSPVYDFYTGLRKQMANAASLFQPPFFSLDANTETLTGPAKVIGVFSAAAESKSVRYIYRDELPIYQSISLLPGDCRAFVDHSTNIAPPFWN